MNLVKDCRLRNEILNLFGFTGEPVTDVQILASNRKEYNGEDFKCFLKELKLLFTVYRLFTPNSKDKSFIERLRFCQCLACSSYVENMI